MRSYTAVLMSCIVALALVASAEHSILDYGGIPSATDNDSCWTNSAALTAAILAANSSSSDRVALVPAGYSFFIFEVEASYLQDVTIRIDGDLLVSNNITAWPTENSRHTMAALYIGDSEGIILEGSGTFDGQGYDWWWTVLLTAVDQRPMLVCMERVQDLIIRQLTFQNSPEYHLDIRDIKDVHIYDIDIWVDMFKQKALLQEFGHWDHSYQALAGFPKEAVDFGIPTFPLNTDGIDPQGINILIENVTISNFDDAVAVKPQNGGNKFSNCSEQIIIRDSTVNFGVGMTIGSVPPNDKGNCVKDVLFDNITFNHPIKAVYVKTNPGTSGWGLIDNITYSNIRADASLWYPIWIGPQQQKQPGTSGTGCSFFYPIVDECPTNPRVPISNMKLVNMTMERGVFLPGVLLCNATNPCTGFEFDNVQNSGYFVVQDDYVCENVEGYVKNSNPAPSCLTAQ